MQAVDARLVTPEAVVLQFDTAGLGSRFLARMLDTLVQSAALFIFSFVFFAAFSGTGGTALAIVYLIAVFLILFGYNAALETMWRGRTLGKAAVGLRVVTREGAPIRFRHAAIRSALFIVDGLLVVGPTVGVLAILLSRNNQRLGDMVAGTLVVRERSGARAPVATTFPVPMGCDAYVATLDVSALSGAEYEAVRALLLRAPTLPPNARYDLARQVGTHVAGRMRHTPPGWAHPELFLACVAAAFQLRSGGPAVPWMAPPPAAPAPTAPGPGGQWGAAPAQPPVATTPPESTDGGFAPPA